MGGRQHAADETAVGDDGHTREHAVVTALEKFNRLQRLRELNAKLRGTFVDFMTLDDLKTMREDAKWAKNA